jgi:2-C-methyl-D-erythritol 2,4-cyclodiphosphate synthase
VVERVRGAGLEPASADLTVNAERPAIAPARDEIREALAGVLGVAAERVSVKATRPEGLGLSGDGVGCLALAVLQAP